MAIMCDNEGLITYHHLQFVLLAARAALLTYWSTAYHAETVVNFL
jgi:hypothetical protein